MEERIIINDYIENDPLSENNLDKTLDLVNKIRLSSPKKSVWLYTGYTWENIWNCGIHGTDLYGKPWDSYSIFQIKWQEIVKQCDVLVDGQYIDSQRVISLPYRGSSNRL